MQILRSVFFLYFVPCILYLFLSGCGFHLRGVGTTDFPADLVQMHVSLDGFTSAHAPMLEEMKNALKTMAGVTLVDDEQAGVPHLQLSGERFDSQVLSVDSSARVSEYLLKLEIGYTLYAAGGETLIDRKILKLQRDYTFDRLNVLAKEKEERELRAALRRDAAQQIVRRIARLSRMPTGDK